MAKYKVLSGDEENVGGIARAPLSMSKTEVSSRKEAIKEVEGNSTTTKKRTSKRFKGRFSKRNILKKPKVKLPSYSATRALNAIADTTDSRLVKEPEVEIRVHDDRSLFFKEEFINEKEKMRRGVL